MSCKQLEQEIATVKYTSMQESKAYGTLISVTII